MYFLMDSVSSQPLPPLCLPVGNKQLLYLQ